MSILTSDVQTTALQQATVECGSLSEALQGRQAMDRVVALDGVSSVGYTGPLESTNAVEIAVACEGVRQARAASITLLAVPSVVANTAALNARRPRPQPITPWGTPGVA